MSTISPSPAERISTPVDGVDVLGALSPSRAGDFLSCPLLYRFRTIDRLPEPTSVDALRGTLVHKVLEDLFDLPAGDRTPDRAAAMVEPTWAALSAADPALEELFGAEGPEIAGWLGSCRSSLARYFTLEDPRRLEPAEREAYVETVLDSRLLLRGFIDRLDVSPDGLLRVVDYKTSRSPSERFEAKALFQLRVYALILWRTRGVVPTVLQLVYLGNGEIISYRPDVEDLLATQRKVEAIWAAIRVAEESGDWRPSTGPLCRFCAHRAVCPAYGGTPPPLPVREVEDPGTIDPGSVLGGERPQVGGTERGEGVTEDPAGAGGHRDVVLDDEHPAPGRLG
ncbi:RecB family exonuclease [Nocardioides insulae]|uniref:RecB family exonuclease n=1 Tax=Nocardioides insulae TaxID=394734 RepID=UPI0004129441|nr:PD-(D/E)XK nuclease family protein [Nocardioides insulae]